MEDNQWVLEIARKIPLCRTRKSRAGSRFAKLERFHRNRLFPRYRYGRLWTRRGARCAAGFLADLNISCGSDVEPPVPPRIIAGVVKLTTGFELASRDRSLPNCRAPRHSDHREYQQSEGVAATKIYVKSSEYFGELTDGSADLSVYRRTLIDYGASAQTVCSSAATAEQRFGRPYGDS